MREPADAACERLLYVIHAADDHALAGFLKDEFQARVSGVRVFVASRAGQIPTGSNWLNDIKTNLTAATIFIVLLTPRSKDRPWVWYEAGVAFGRGVRLLPIAAGGLSLGEIPLPLGADQSLTLEKPEHVELLFREFGVRLEAPDLVCEQARRLMLAPPSARPSATRIREIHQAFGELGDGPKFVLKQMLKLGGLNFKEVREELKSSGSGFAADGHSVQGMIDALKARDLVEGDAEGRLRVRPELESAIAECFNPPLSTKLRLLAEEIARWTDGQPDLIDTNAFHQRFKARVEAVRDLARLHGETDDRLMNLNASSVGGARRIVDGLQALSQRVA